jgi:hypothetical protein
MQKVVQEGLAIDERTVQLAAIDGPDLKPLWNRVGGTLWKKAE